MKFIFLLEKILPLAFWILLIFGFDSAYMAILTIIAALIHEGGHLIATAPFSKKRSKIPRSNIAGFRIDTNALSYKEEFVAALGGPIINLVIGLIFIFLPFSQNFKTYAYMFGILNIMTMISNLLPIEGYDGHKALSALIAVFFGDSLMSEVILHWISFFFSAIMTFLALYLMLKLGEGYWIFAVFFSVMLSAIIKKQNNTIYENK